MDPREGQGQGRSATKREIENTKIIATTAAQLVWVVVRGVIMRRPNNIRAEMAERKQTRGRKAKGAKSVSVKLR
jgi:hypothetical protein